MPVPKNEKTLVDLNYEYETGSGRVIVDPAEAEVELGKALASQLKLDKSGKVVLWPQPSDDRHDPQNWSDSRKLKNLIISTMAAFIPDFNSGIGVACLFPLAREYQTTPGEINNVSSNWSIFLLGPGGLIAVMLAKRYGRLPILFWSQVLGLAFLIGCTFAPNLSTFAAMRCLNAFFSTAPQVTGLLAVTDMYPFHLQARMLNFWSAGFLVSPYMSPWLFGYLVDNINYRWAYAIGSFYGIFVVLLIAFFVEETIYDRYLTLGSDSTARTTPTSRLKTLVGITGYKTAHIRCSWKQAIMPTFKLLTKPHCLLLLIYMGVVFGFAIGINVTNVVFTSSPPPLGYGLRQVVVASLYATPVVAVFLGEVIGRYLNDKTVSILTSRNHGVFEPEMRLWTLYIGIPPIAAGFVVLGGAFQYKWNLAAVVFGWGMAEVGIMITTVAILNYLNNSFFFPGEISALMSQARILGGFAVPYFQIEWASKKGALQSFGCEAAIQAGLFLLAVPFVQLKGEKLRVEFDSQAQVIGNTLDMQSDNYFF
ncbi:hypothetical protein PCANC_00168 [Puccinia coronata f. sp. avenae]|uniref:Major facilitator superfamily (MFS) profile domain-containing protein n=1 Tax=Puccinia coronata f. sp. avenae TaxID=200324 RepID=A0A2N5T007_9BASI|nr:hypothetical protein PCASD_19059 [Puccinia coronata f. sp. avenae]PLW18798.1 hypothetical protein PCANC_06613 [Puccinia coronata f. sp. avenae]PLW58552.1 hypothetical protein PCANC_00168 [Puccinia coronata f. sp. avenae]